MAKDQAASIRLGLVIYGLFRMFSAFIRWWSCRGPAGFALGSRWAAPCDEPHCENPAAEQKIISSHVRHAWEIRGFRRLCPLRRFLLRHTVATTLLFNGCPIGHIHEILGHERLETT